MKLLCPNCANDTHQRPEDVQLFGSGVMTCQRCGVRTSDVAGYVRHSGALPYWRATAYRRAAGLPK